MLSHLRRSTYELRCLRAEVCKLLGVFRYQRCLVVSLRIFFFFLSLGYVGSLISLIVCFFSSPILPVSHETFAVDSNLIKQTHIFDKTVAKKKTKKNKKHVC
jgi:hypothetical protein